MGVENSGACAVVLGQRADTGEVCRIRVADVPRRAYLRVREDAPEAMVHAMIDTIRQHLHLAQVRYKFTDGRGKMNVAFGDPVTCGYGHVRAIKALFPRTCPPLPREVSALGAGAENVFPAVLATGAMGAAEDLALNRRLRTWDLAYVTEAVQTGPHDYSIAGTGNIAAVAVDAELAPTSVLGFRLLFVRFDARTRTASYAAEDAIFDQWQPTGAAWCQARRVPCAEANLSALCFDGPDPAALAAAKAFATSHRTALVVYATSAERAALAQTAAPYGSVPAMFTGTGPGACVLEDWSTADPGASADTLADAFEAHWVLWRAVCLAREARTTLYEALPHVMPRLADLCFAAELCDLNIVIPDWPKAAGDLASKRGHAKYAGGHVIDPVVGLHDGPVHMLDFSGLYPAIVRERCICPTNRSGLCTDPESCPLPRVMGRLVTARNVVKLCAHRRAADLASDYKLTANALIGLFGMPRSRFHSIELAASVTAAGRDNLRGLCARAGAVAGVTVLGGDTDSLFLKCPAELADRIVCDTNRATRFLRIRCERVARSMLTVSKKRYAFVNAETGVIEVKGLQCVKSDYPPITRECSEAYLRCVLVESGPPTAALTAAATAYRRSVQQPSNWIFRQRPSKHVSAVGATGPDGKFAAAYTAGPGGRGCDLVAVADPADLRPDTVYGTEHFVLGPLANLHAAALGCDGPNVRREVANALGIPGSAPPAPRGMRQAVAWVDPYIAVAEAAGATIRYTCGTCGATRIAPMTADSMIGSVCQDVECMDIVYPQAPTDDMPWRERRACYTLAAAAGHPFPGQESVLVTLPM
ncbi:MAG: hypothetical protein M0R22_12685 [Dehalococcoidia bacterium]|nr:hypothetical protein [Dehalococcoidia bacterium]